MRGLTPAGLGVVLALISYAVYSTGDALVKALGGSLGPFEIGFFVTLFSLIPALIAKPKAERWRDTFRFHRPWLVQLVAVTRTICAVSITYSFVTIPLAEAYSIVFLTPVFTIVLSILVLREEVTLDRWALAVLSFVGVVIVVRPGFRELELGHLTALLCAICAAIAVIAMRSGAGTEKRTSLFLMPALYTLCVNTVLVVATGFVAPGWLLLGGLLACGVCGGIGFLLQITALGKSPASLIAPAQYSQMVWALIYGALIFHEVPDTIGFVGLGVVVAAGIANIFTDGARARIAGRWAEYRARREATGPSGFKGPGPDPV